MVGHRRFALAALFPAALAGCGGMNSLGSLGSLGGGSVGWVHVAKSPAEFGRDDASCRQQAIEKVQTSHQKQDAPKWMTRAVGTPSYFFDGNDTTREQWHKSCLQMMGWAPDHTSALSGLVSSEVVQSGLLAGFQYLIR